MMKNTFMLFLTGMLIFLLAACGQGDAPAEVGEGQEEQEEQETIEDEVDEEDGEIEEVEMEEEEEELTETNSNEQATEETTDEETSNIPVELIFADDQVMDMYRVERLIEATDDELFVKTLEEWVAGPTEEGLASLVPNNVEIQSVEDIDGTAHVSFSAEFLDAQVGSGPEAMLLQQIAMIMKQFGFNETQILIDGEIHPELFGHMTTDEPIVADDLENYEKVN